MDVLCSDKTGTLTLNKLTVDKNLVEVLLNVLHTTMPLFFSSAQNCQLKFSLHMQSWIRRALPIPGCNACLFQHVIGIHQGSGQGDGVLIGCQGF